MTNRATLEALLARVLAGTGPDRELDGALAEALQVGGNPWKHDGDGWISVHGFGCQAAMFTTSLDAALTVVPEGWRINLLSEWDNETIRAKGAWQAILMPIGKGDSIHAGMRTRCDHAATPARALIAACLKARMEAQND